MNLVDIVSEPLFQLNLVLFLNMPAPPNGEIDPIFYNAGYTLFGIEYELAVPPRKRLEVSNSGIHLNSSVPPELILEHPATFTFVLVECKTSSFSPSSSTSRQARSYLCFDGHTLKTIIGKPASESWATTVAYFSLAETGAAIYSTLTALKNELGTIPIATAENIASLEWLVKKDDGIYIVDLSAPPALPSINCAVAQRIVKLTAGGDPRTLQLIPYATNSGSINDQIFHEKLKSVFVSLAARVGRRPQVFNLDEDIIKQVIPVWDKLVSSTESKFIRRKTRDILRSLCNQLKEHVGIDYQIRNQDFSIPSATPDQIRQARTYLQSSEMRRTTLPNLRQRSLNDVDASFETE